MRLHHINVSFCWRWKNCKWRQWRHMTQRQTGMITHVTIVKLKNLYWWTLSNRLRLEAHWVWRQTLQYSQYYSTENIFIIVPIYVISFRLIFINGTYLWHLINHQNLKANLTFVIRSIEWIGLIEYKLSRTFLVLPFNIIYCCYNPSLAQI